MNYHSIIDKIRKVYNLSKSDNENESKTANLLLEQLLKKHNISLDEIVSEKKYQHTIKYFSEYDKKIIGQVCNSLDIDLYYTSTKTRKRIKCFSFEATKLEIAEALSKISFYRSLFKREQEMFFKAFVHKHNLFSSNAKYVSGRLSQDEKNDLLKKMNAMSDVTYLKTLKTGK